MLSCSCRHAARASASSMASLVPEPMEKCAVCAASPSSTTFSCRQVWHRIVANVVQRELLANRLCYTGHWAHAASTSAHRSRMRWIEASSL